MVSVEVLVSATEAEPKNNSATDILNRNIKRARDSHAAWHFKPSSCTEVNLSSSILLLLPAYKAVPFLPSSLRDLDPPAKNINLVKKGD